MQAATTKNTKGIDISHWLAEVTDAQGNIIPGVNGIDFNAVKQAGIQFMYSRAIIDTRVDDYFLSTAIGARSVGIPIGGFHYVNIHNYLQDPEALAQAFIDTLEATFGKGQYGDLLPVLDVEEPQDQDTLLALDKINPVTGKKSDAFAAGDMLPFILRYKNYFEANTGVPLMIYTAEWWVVGESSIPFRGFQDFYGNNNPLKTTPLWTAAWTRYGAQFPRDYGGWTKWAVWQHSDQGNVPGISDRGLRYGSPVGSINTFVDLDYGPENLSDITIKYPVYPMMKTNYTVPIITSIFGFVAGLMITRLLTK